MKNYLLKSPQLLARFDRIVIESDGNCLFRAILCCLVGDDSCHLELRTLVSNHIVDNKESYADVVPDNDVDLYTQNLMKDGVWGDHLELIIASNLLSFNFCIHKSKSIEIYLEHNNSPNYSTIYLEYFNQNHFNSLILKQGSKILVDLKSKIKKPAKKTYKSYISGLKTSSSSIRSSTKEIINAFYKYSYLATLKDEKKSLTSTSNDQENTAKIPSLNSKDLKFYDQFKQGINNDDTGDESDYYDSDFDSDYYPSGDSESCNTSDTKIGSDEAIDDLDDSYDEAYNSEDDINECSAKRTGVGLYPEAKAGYDTYNEAYRYLTRKKAPERYENNLKGFRNWVKALNYYICTDQECKISRSSLYFRSSKNGNVAIPLKSEIEALISIAHYGSEDDSLIKHNGFNTVIQDLNEKKIYWANMSEYVRDFIANCAQCNEEMVEKPIKIPKIIISNGPLYRMIADLWQIPKDMSEEALKGSHPCYKYILLCVDHFSKFTWGVLLEDKEGKTLTKQLNLIFHHFKKPTVFQSDNGTEFRNRLMKTLCEKLGVKIIHGSVRHPQSQGAVEKLNDFMGKSMMIAFRNYKKTGTEKRFDIELALKAFINNQNQKIHSRTGWRANKLVHIEDQTIIDTVNNKVRAYYEAKVRIKTSYTIKPGMKVFLIGDLKLDKDTKKIVPQVPQMKNKSQKRQKELKILAKIINVDKIKNNEVMIKICKRPRNGMMLNGEYSSLVDYIAIAKKNRWDSLMKLHD